MKKNTYMEDVENFLSDLDQKNLLTVPLKKAIESAKTSVNSDSFRLGIVDRSCSEIYRQQLATAFYKKSVAGQLVTDLTGGMPQQGKEKLSSVILAHRKIMI